MTRSLSTEPAGGRQRGRGRAARVSARAAGREVGGVSVLLRHAHALPRQRRARRLLLNDPSMKEVMKPCEHEVCSFVK
jgi:hypothetical protein